MIKLNPSVGLIRDTKINFDILSNIISSVIEVKHNDTIRIEKSRKSYSFYDHSKKFIGINLNDHRSTKAIICTLLHEVRHYLQKKEFGNTILFGKYLSYNDYYHSPEEIDARKFEKICGEICTIYKSYIAIEQKLKKHKVNNLKELRKNKAEEKLKL
jgi:hypothetical protein